VAGEISSLTALTGANTAAGDLFEVVDVSDTTLAATGTNKKITRTDMAQALTLIDSQVLASAATNITFTIPSWARHLRIVGRVRGDRGTNPDVLRIGFNGSTSNFTYRFAEFANTGTASYYGESGTGGTVAYIAASPSGAGIYANVDLLISDVQGTTYGKFVSGIAASTERFLVCATRWDSTSAVTSVKFDVSLGTNLVAGTYLTCYGMA
jgi:hypothetical protein